MDKIPIILSASSDTYLTLIENKVYPQGSYKLSDDLISCKDVISINSTSNAFVVTTSTKIYIINKIIDTLNNNCNCNCIDKNDTFININCLSDNIIIHRKNCLEIYNNYAVKLLTITNNDNDSIDIYVSGNNFLYKINKDKSKWFFYSKLTEYNNLDKININNSFILNDDNFDIKYNLDLKQIKTIIETPKYFIIIDNN